MAAVVNERLERIKEIILTELELYHSELTDPQMALIADQASRKIESWLNAQ